MLFTHFVNKRMLPALYPQGSCFGRIQHGRKVLKQVFNICDVCNRTLKHDGRKKGSNSHKGLHNPLDRLLCKGLM